MSGDDFNRVFGTKQPNHPGFAERVGRADGFGARNEPGTDGAPGTGVYKAYGFLPTGNVGETCEIRSWVKGTDMPEGVVFQYRFLMQVGFVGDELLRLMLPDCIIVIEGRGLTDLRQKLSRRMVTFVQQHHSGVWGNLPPGEAVIEKVEIVRPDTMSVRV